MRRLSRKEYADCDTTISGYGDTLFERLSCGELDEGRYVFLDGKLTEWEAELERKKPLLLRRSG